MNKGVVAYYSTVKNKIMPLAGKWIKQESKPDSEKTLQAVILF